MKTIKNFLIIPFNVLYRVSPKLTLSILFFIKHGYLMSFKKPKSYNQKLNWIKLYHRDPLYKLCADKLKMRDYIKSIELDNLLPKLLWNGEKAGDIPFDDLPNQFVIKTTHGSGNNIICTNKSKLDKEKVIKKLNSWLKAKYLPAYGEWVYNVKNPQIIIEEFLSDDNMTPPEDYKLFCFNKTGTKDRVSVIALDIDRFDKHKRYIYDREWNLLENINFDFPNPPSKVIKKPSMLDQIVEYANLISEPFPHARIDFYIIKEKVYIGEITFFNGAGFDKITPKSFDFYLGDLINLSELENYSEMSIKERWFDGN